MDFSAFSEDDFNVKDWMNIVFENEEASQNKEGFASSLVMRLQLFIQEMNSSLEETSQQMLQNLPRVVRETAIIEEEAKQLAEKMTMIKTDISKVEKTTAETMHNLIQLDTVKSRMQSTSKALEEADNWTTLNSDVEEVFESGQVTEIAQKLIAMQRSLEILADVPDYKDRFDKFEKLKNRLEAILSPQSVAAFSSNTTDMALMYACIYRDISRIEQFQKCYHHYHKVQLSEQWKRIIESDQEETICEHLTNFYCLLMSYWHAQVKWCSIVLPEQNSAKVLSELFSDVLRSLDPSLAFCIEAGMKQQSRDKVLDYVIQLKQGADRFVKNLEVVLRNTGCENEPFVISLLSTVYEPFKVYVDKYAQLEENMMINELEQIKISTSDLMGSSRILNDCNSKVFAIAEKGIERCDYFSNSYAFLYFLKALKSYFVSFASRARRNIQLIQNADISASHPLTGDWTLFQQSLQIVESFGDILLKVDDLDNTLLNALLDFDQKNKKAHNKFLSVGDYILTEKARKELDGFITMARSAKNDGFMTKDIRQIIAKLCEDAVSAAFSIVTSHVDESLSNLPFLKVWSQDSSGAVGLGGDLPSFSFSPQEYITQIGQLLMTLPQHLELFVAQDNPGLLIALKQYKPLTDNQGSLDQNEQIAEFILRGLAHGVMELFTDSVIKIPHVTHHSTKQLLADSEYLCSVVDDLGVHPLENFQSIMRLLKAPEGDFLTEARGKPGYLIASIIRMRNLKVNV